MPSVLTARETIRVGTPVAIEAPAPAPPYMAVFEDDGDTAYLYGLDTTKDNPILDALHIYNVASVTDRAKPSVVEIAWSGDHLKCVLFINRYPHAAFDFGSHRGYCRSNFPPPDHRWTSHSHEWDDAILECLR